MEEKDSYKILVVTDIHDDIEKIKILVDKVKDIKFDFVFVVEMQLVFQLIKTMIQK